MPQYTSSFQDMPADASVGGKAAALVRLTQAGFPVPQGAVIFADAYEAHVGANGLRERIRSLVEGVDLDDPQAVHERMEQVQRLITDAPVPDDVVAELTAAYGALVGDGAGQAVAVRSSATHEDAEGASSAGQYATYLNIIDEEAMLDAVRACWASLWTPQALHYRHQAGQRHDEAAMGVVIQHMVPSTASGVAFTVDPITADPTKVVINATWGLGQGLVAGSVSGDLFTVDKRTLDSSGAVIGNKERQVVPDASGRGTVIVSTEPELRRQPALDSGQLRAVAELARDIEDAFGAPQDVEWGLFEGRVQLLQSRPITGMAEVVVGSGSADFPFEWPDEADAQHHWRLEFATKRDPLVPLDIGLRHYWYKAREEALYLGGSFVSRISEARIFNGYPYVRNSTLTLTEEEADALTAKHNARVQAYIDQGTSLWDQEILPEIKDTLAGLFPVPGPDAGFERLIDYMERVLAMYQRLWALHWLMAGGGARDTLWPELFSEITGTDDALLAYDLLQGQENMTTRLMNDLHGLARSVQGDPELRRLFDETDEWDLAHALRTGPEYTDFLASLDAFLHTFGYRTGHSFGSTATLATAPWVEEPAIVFRILKRYLDQDLGEFQRLSGARDQEREVQTAQVRAGLSERPDSLARFDKELHTWKARTVWMENHNYYIDQVTSALVHIAFSRIGQALLDEGAIESLQDVFFLTLDELRGTADRSTHAALADNARQRETLYAWWRRLAPPAGLGAPPPPPPEGAPRPAPDTLGHDENAGNEPVVRGQPAVKGRHSGRARVVTDPDIVPRVEPGDILVAMNAGEQWTPVFPVLGALVLDEGSVLQHAAIVAREFGVPMVIQTKEATTRIRDGQTITVDGARGIVELGI